MNRSLERARTVHDEELDKAARERPNARRLHNICERLVALDKTTSDVHAQAEIRRLIQFWEAMVADREGSYPDYSLRLTKKPAVPSSRPLLQTQAAAIVKLINEILPNCEDDSAQMVELRNELRHFIETRGGTAAGCAELLSAILGSLRPSVAKGAKLVDVTRHVLIACRDAAMDLDPAISCTSNPHPEFVKLERKVNGSMIAINSVGGLDEQPVLLALPSELDEALVVLPPFVPSASWTYDTVEQYLESEQIIAVEV